jgi:hypothetical protein
MSATASEILQEALDVLERHVPADTEDGAVIEKVSNAIQRFKANSRDQKREPGTSKKPKLDVQTTTKAVPNLQASF